MAVTTVGSIHVVDVVVIVVYFVSVLAVGLVSSWLYWRKEKREKGGGTTAGFFLAGRNMHWSLVGASLFASNIGSGHFVGLAGSAAAGGIAVAGFELNAAFVLIALGWLFVPVYLAAGVYTMPEYLKMRFGGRRIQTYLSCLALLLYVFTKISADLYAGTIFIEKSLNLNTYLAIFILLAIACVFTATGGLTAVIWTDAIQVVIMLIGAAILMIFSFNEVGGYNAMVDQYFVKMPVVPENETAPKSCLAGALPRTDALSLLRGVDADLPWTGMTFGLTISAVWYWCSDQVIVQRALAAKNLNHARMGCVFASWLKFLPLWLLIFPGMVARVLYAEDILCYSPESCMEACGKPSQCTDVAYPTLVVKLMPIGLRGLMLAVMLSALMSSLTSIFNSSSTLFTMDIWKLIRKNATDRELLWVGRIFVVVLVGVSILWIPVIKTFPNSELFNYIQAVTSYLAPPVCAVYVLAIFVPRINETGAFWGLMIGLVTGLIRFAMEIGYGTPTCDNPYDPRPSVLKDVHFLHFGILLFVLSCITTTVISLMTEPIPEEQLLRLTFWSRFSEKAPNAIRRMEKRKVHPSDNGEQIEMSPDEPQGREEERPNYLLEGEENPFWARICDIQAIGVVAGCVWFYVFYFCIKMSKKVMHNSRLSDSTQPNSCMI